MPGDYPTCGAKTRAGTPCKHRAGQRTSHEGTGRCWLHGGASPQAEAAGARQELQRRAGSMATAIRMEPIDALLHVVYAQAGRVQWIGGELANMEGPLFGEDGRMAPVALAHRAELKQLAVVSDLALRAGVAERRVQMAERTGALIGAAFEDALAEVGSDVLPPALRLEIVRRFAAGLMMLEAPVDGDLPALADG